MTSTWSGACSAQHLLIITGFDLFNACKDKGRPNYGRNSVHLQAYAAKKFPNISCMIGCNINRCTYICLPTCRSSLCLVACCGICGGDVATGWPLEAAGSLKIRQIYIWLDFRKGHRQLQARCLEYPPPKLSSPKLL